MNRKLILKDLSAEHCNNILQPIQCVCGCGNYGEIIIGDTVEDNVFSLAGSLLQDIECGSTWIFIIEDWTVSGAYTTENDNGERTIQYFSTAVSENKPLIDFEHWVEFTKSMIEKIEPCCIGVLQHTKEGRYRIVMEDIYDRKAVKKVKVKKKKKNPLS